MGPYAENETQQIGVEQKQPPYPVERKSRGSPVQGRKGYSSQHGRQQHWAEVILDGVLAACESQVKGRAAVLSRFHIYEPGCVSIMSGCSRIFHLVIFIEST